MEVCIDSFESASNAERGGAARVELCANLLEGGTTPSIGMLRMIKKTLSIPVFVMIRPRGGDFCYSDSDLQVMKEDINSLKEAGADGFVFGILTCDGYVDERRCKELLDLCHPFPTTFHRAIDMSRDIFDSLIKITDLGFSRILSSGSHQTALQGASVLKEMILQAKNRIIIMPGGGIQADNLAEIIKTTGAKEFHGTAREAIESKMTFRKTTVCMGSIPDAEYTRKVTSTEMVATFLKTAHACWKEKE